MTKTEKIKILKGAVRVLKEDRGSRGICFAVRQVTKESFDSYTYKNLQKLGIIKPRKPFRSTYWFPKTPEGTKQRIDLLKKAIKKLERKIK